MEGRLVKLGEDDYILHVNNKPFAYKKLSLKNCQAIENGYDLDEMSKNRYPIENTGAMFMPNRHEVTNIYRQEGFIEGAKAILEILGDKKFSEEDVKFMFQLGFNLDNPISKNEYDVHIQSLQKTEWDCIVEMEENCPYDYTSRCTQGRCDCKKPKLDEDGCLILKRK